MINNLEISNEAYAEALRQARLAGLGLRQYLRKILEEAIKKGPPEWPEFREYARRKYPELDEDLITMIEDLIERQRGLKDEMGGS